MEYATVPLPDALAGTDAILWEGGGIVGWQHARGHGMPVIQT